MKSDKITKTKQDNKKKRPWLIPLVIGAIILVVGLWIYFVKTTTYPLGDKLEYIGKKDYGCWLFCDSNPASTYYYATDMTIEEVIKYFQKTSIEREPSAINGETYFALKTPSGETVYLYYYEDGGSLTEQEKLSSTNKAHVLKLPSFKYQVLKNAL